MPSQVIEPDNAVSRHRVPRELIERIFAGSVDAPTVAALRDGQHSRRLLLLKVLRELTASAPTVPERQTGDEAWRILVDAEKRAPDVVREILLYPSVGTWLVRVVRKIRGIVDDDVPIWVDMGYLTSIAAAAAIRAGIDATGTVLVWRGRVNLPTVGQFEISDGDVTRLARLRVRGSAAFVESTEEKWISLDEVRSFPLRRHRSVVGGHTVSWTVDDIDPYRTFAELAAPDRLAPAEYEHWSATLDGAWAILAEDHADQVREVAAAEPVVVPVRRSGGFVASSSAASFGAVCAVLPEDPVAMAETVLHELQHSKLNALLDLVPLVRSGVDRSCYAPWRRDPRPLGGLLHGIYAFVAVTEYWYRRSVADPTDRVAVFQFMHGRQQVREALRALGAVPEVTEMGARLLEVAAARLSACDDGAVPDDVRAAVMALGAENRLVWRIRHLAPRADHVHWLADRWLAGDSAARQVEVAIQPFHRPGAESALSGLLKARALELEPRVAGPEVRPGERELVEHDHVSARSAFVERIRADPDDDGAWVGLLLGMNAYGGDELPGEAVAATYRRIVAVSGALPAPDTVVKWFAHR